jgi:hypothetical protein
MEFNKDFLKPSLPPAVLPQEPKQLHERLWIQQGLFLAPTDPTRPFLENLVSLINTSVEQFQTPDEKWSKELKDRLIIPAGLSDKFPNAIYAVKLILPKELHYDIINDLQRMNINAATLFPGLDGFARSMFYHLSSNTKYTNFLRNIKKHSQKSE